VRLGNDPLRCGTRCCIQAPSSYRHATAIHARSKSPCNYPLPTMNPTTYTFNVRCTIEMQYTFAAADVMRHSGDESDVEPTDSAIRALGEELAAMLNHNYGITEVDVFTDPSRLVGSDED
jgi:hypothetical protein